MRLEYLSREKTTVYIGTHASPTIKSLLNLANKQIANSQSKYTHQMGVAPLHYKLEPSQNLFLPIMVLPD